jgi:hypothetical protein
MPEIKIKGKSFKTRVGSRAEVWHGTAFKTSGGLTKSHLLKNKSGRIVSKAKYVTAKREKRLVKAGYGTKKGKFGFVMLGKKGKMGKKGTRSRKHRGGNGTNYALSPSSYDGAGVGTSGVDLQFVAGNAA